MMHTLLHLLLDLWDLWVYNILVVVRYWGKKKYTNLLKLALGFVATYIVIDLIILLRLVSTE
jgi:hypothetical protein